MIGCLIVVSTVGVFLVMVSFLLSIILQVYFISPDQSQLFQITAYVSKYNGLLLLGCVIFIILMTMNMLSDCNRRPMELFIKDAWKKILISLPLIGLISYYVSSYYKINIVKLKITNNETFLKLVYYSSYGGSLAAFGLIVLLFFVAGRDSLFKIVLITEMFLIVYSAIATFIFYIISVLDAVNRPQEVWEKEDLLSLINPWSWVFGLRKYYYRYLLPSAR